MEKARNPRSLHGIQNHTQVAAAPRPASIDVILSRSNSTIPVQISKKLSNYSKLKYDQQRKEAEKKSKEAIVNAHDKRKGGNAAAGGHENAADESAVHDASISLAADILLDVLSFQDSRHSQVIIELLPEILLQDRVLLKTFFDYVVGNKFTSSAFKGLVLGHNPTNIVMRLIFKVFELKPSTVYSILASYLNDQKTRAVSLLLMGRMVLAFRKHARRISETQSWVSLLALMRSEKDVVVVSLGIWLLVILIPHVCTSLPDHLIDILYILKRTIIEFPLLSKDKSVHTVHAAVEIDGKASGSGPAVFRPHPKPGNSTGLDGKAGAVITEPVSNLSNSDRMCRINGAEKFVLEFFKMIYALFPCEIVAFLQAECIAYKPLKSTLQRYFCSVRLHPALITSPMEGQGHGCTTMASSRTPLNWSSDAQTSKRTSLKKSPHSALKQTTNMSGDKDYEAEMSENKNYSTSYTNRTESAQLKLKAWMSLSPEEVQSLVEELSIPTKSQAATLSSKMPDLELDGDDIQLDKGYHENIFKKSGLQSTKSASNRLTSASGERAMVGSSSPGGPDSSPKISKLSCPNPNSVCIGEAGSKDDIYTGSFHSDSMLALASNELLYERHLRQQQEWKFRRIRRKIHAQSVQLEESHIWRTQLKNQVRITNDLQAAIAREREQAKQYRHSHKNWSDEMRKKVMRQRDEYVQVAERNVELQDSVNHLRETITQLKADLSAAKTEMYTLKGLAKLSKVADKAKKDAELEVEALQMHISSMEHVHQAQTDATLLAAVENRDDIIYRLGKKIATLKDELAQKSESHRNQNYVKESQQQQPLWKQLADIKSGVNSKIQDTELSSDDRKVGSTHELHELLNTHPIIVRLREHVSRVITDNSDPLTYHNIQTLLVDEFGETEFARYKHLVQHELEIASKVNPRSYHKIFYSNNILYSDDHKVTSCEFKSSSHSSSRDYPKSYDLSQENNIEHLKQSIPGHSIFEKLSEKSERLNQLLNETRANLGEKIKQLERRSMSTSRLNIALEKRLMQSMQENEILRNRLRRLGHSIENNEGQKPDIKNQHIDFSARQSAARIFGRQPSNGENTQPKDEYKIEAQSIRKENFGERLSGILSGALRSSRVTDTADCFQ